MTKHCTITRWACLIIVSLTLGACSKPSASPAGSPGVVGESSATTRLASTTETAASSPTPKAGLRRYPVIPIPEDVVYQGVHQIAEFGEVVFSINQPLDLSEPSVTSYGSRLRQLGWETCVGEDCSIVQSHTVLLGYYQHGAGADRVVMVIGRLEIPEGEPTGEPGTQIVLMLKNCGEPVEVREVNSEPTTGCQVLLPEQFRER